MRYCTLAELERAIPRHTLVQLSNEDSQAAEIDIDVVAGAVQEAEEIVDAHLHGRYALPLDAVLTVIRSITINVAMHALYGRRPEGNDLPTAVSDTYKASMRMLTDIRDSTPTSGGAMRHGTAALQYASTSPSGKNQKRRETTCALSMFRSTALVGATPTTTDSSSHSRR